MIDLGLNQFKIKEIKYEVKEGKTVIFKLRNFNLEDVEIVEELKKEKNDAEFENRKTREMIDVAKSSFDFSGMNRRKKEENNASLKNILDFTLDKTKEIIKNDAKADSEIIKERTEDRIKEDYFKGDPNDEYSSIKSLSDIDGKPIEIKEKQRNIKKIEQNEGIK